MSENGSPVQSLAPGIKPLVLPEIAVKLALGAEINRTPAGMQITFDGQDIQMSEQDFDIAARAAKRIKGAVTKEMSISTILTLAGLAHKHVVEQIFKPGVVRVLYYTAMAKASAFYRCMLPAMMMNRGTRVQAHCTTGGIAREALEFDVVVIQLERNPGALSFCRALQQMGKKVIFELDDAFDALAPWHPCYDVYKTQRAKDEFIQMIRTADLVTVTTEPLKERYQKYAKRIEVLPNCIPLEDWPKAEAHGTGEFRVLWAGSPSHMGDLKVVGNALSNFANMCPQARLIFMGREPVDLVGVQASQIRLMPWCEFDEYPLRLAEAKADLAIAPLADVEFNQYKSNLKLLEYAACGYPVLPSDVGPYRTTILDIGGVDLCRTAQEWEHTLMYLMANPGRRREMQERSREMVKQFDAAEHCGKFEEVFASI